MYLAWFQAHYVISYASKKTHRLAGIFFVLLGTVPWVPEVSRGPLRDLPAEGRPMSASAD